MKKILFAFAVFACLFAPGRIAAQSSNASLGGTVTDASSALIPGVSIRVTNTETGVVTTALTNESGVYTFPSLQPGRSYSVSAELPGFQTRVINGLELGVAQQVRQNFSLQVAGVNTAVDVSIAADSALTSSGASVGEVLPEYKVQALPLVGNNVLDLINIMIGYQGPDDATTSASAPSASLAGLPIMSVNTVMDGLSVNDGRYNLGINSATRINPDMVGEIRLIVAPVDAETGRGSGQVQILTKSGTNKYTGSAYWNVQNTALNANTWNNNRTGATADWMNQQQFSGSYSGPVVRNKTFFFVLYDGQRMRSRVNVTAPVLTEEARKGNFRFFPGVINGNVDTTVNCTGANPVAPVVDVAGNPRAPSCAPNAVLTTVSVFGRDPNRLVQDRTGYVARVLDRMPLPNDFTSGDGLNTAAFRWVRPGDSLIGGQQGLESDVNRDQINTKIDHNFNSAHKANVNWTYEKRRSTTSPSVWPGGWRANTSRTPQVITSSLTSTLSSSLVNEFRFGWRRTKSVTYYPYDDPQMKDEVLAFLPNQNGYPIIGAPFGYASNLLNPGLNSNGNSTPLFSFADSLSWARGRHAFKGGVEARISSTKGFNSLNGIPHVTPGASANFPVQNIETAPIPGLIGTGTGNPIGNLTGARNLLLTLSGSISSVTQAFILNDANQTDRYLDYLEPDGYYKTREFHQKEFSVFLKDDWKILPSLTLNLGVRYEYFGVPWETHGLAAALAGGGYSAFGWTGRSFADWHRFGPQKGELSVVQFVGKNSPNPDAQIYKDDWNNVGPAIGFSWQLPWFGEGRTTVRGGYGISYTGGGGGLDLDTAVGSMPGINDSQNVTPSTFTDLSTIALPVPRNRPLQPVPLNQRNQNIIVYDPNYVSPYIQNFNLSVTRTLQRNVTLDVRWVATRGTKLAGNLALNQVNYTTNGLLEALEMTRRGEDAPLFDRMFQGLNVSGSTAGFGPVGSTVGGVLQTGSMHLRQNNTFRGNIANGNFAAVASSLNTSTIGGSAGQLIRNGGFPENFIVNNPQFNGVQFNTNPGNSIYHSLQTSVTVRPIAGISYQGTYAWSKGIQSDNNGFLNVVDRALNRSIQQDTRKHEFRFNGTFEMPFGPNRLLFGNSSGILARVLERWQTSVILNLASGKNLSITGTNTYIGGGRPDVVGPLDALKDGNAHMTATLPRYYAEGLFTLPDDPQCAGVTTLQATSGACTNNAVADSTGRLLIVNSAPGKLGNLGDGVIVGPGSFRFDLSASKTVRVDESKSFQIRIDAQNVLNHPTLGDPNLNINSANFGQIGAGDVSGSRRFQGQLRFTF